MRNWQCRLWSWLGTALAGTALSCSQSSNFDIAPPLEPIPFSSVHQSSDSLPEASGPRFPMLLQAGGGGSGSSSAGGGASGAGAPSQSPGAPTPQTGLQPAPEAAAPTPSYGPLGDYFALKKRLEESTGTTPRLNIDLTTQSALSGSDEFTAWVWRYDFGIQQKLWTGAQMDINIRGGEGPDAGGRLGSTMNTNQYAGTPNRGFPLHVWFEQKLWEDQLTFRAGKLDLGDWMDVNRFGYYNFLGFSMNHNPAIPLPGNPLAAMFTFEPKNPDWLYFSAGIANAEQSSLRLGYHELRTGQSSPFVMAELGLKLNFNRQPGVYRFIGWYDGRDLPDIGGNGLPESDSRAGFAISFDQNITRELGLFARYGLADQSEFNPRHYWQAGFDWKGIIPGRPKDDLALAIAQNVFSSRRAAVVANAASTELYAELYYNAVIYDWLQVQPFLQVLSNPGGVRDQSDAWIVGVHLAFRF